MLIFKDVNNKYRWIGVTASNHLDRDHEYIAAKALIADVERSNQSRVYGPLRWWHEGVPDAQSAEMPWGPGIDLGECDYAAIYREGEHVMLIESGTFFDERIGAHLGKAQDNYAFSIGFFSKGINAERAHEWIFRIERSLAPKSAVSNRLTWFNVKKDNNIMDEQKREELLNLLGGDAELVNAIEQKARETAEKAKALKLGTKTVAKPYDQFAKLIEAGIDPLVAFKAVSENAQEASGASEIQETTSDTTHEGNEPQKPAQAASEVSVQSIVDEETVTKTIQGILENYFAPIKQELATVTAVAKKASDDIAALKASVDSSAPGTNRVMDNKDAQAIAAALKTSGVQANGDADSPKNQLESQFQRFLFGNLEPVK